ncbi:hypothetical protein [Lonsdalea populi]|uniref:hypothetical protein n=1 Tax=Lonsdalea populi TaxID=1172565 RepID=UPI0011BF6F76|nr:hypothetical protein [Lonsdalea populi]
MLSDLNTGREPGYLSDVVVADRTGELKGEALPTQRLPTEWISEAPCLGCGINLFDKSCAIATISP